MKQKYRSETAKRGPPDDHESAIVKAALFLLRYRKSKSYFITVSYPVDYPEEFIEEHKLEQSNRDHFSHIFDIAILDEHYKPLAFVEMNGNIGYYYFGPASKRNWKIANPTKHSKKLQMINDGINKAYAESIGAKYLTLLKEEVNGDAKDPDREKNSIQYLQRELIDWIK